MNSSRRHSVDYLAVHGVPSACAGKMSLSEVGAVLVEAAAELQSVSELDATRIVFLGGSLGGGGVLATLSHPEFNRHPPSAVIALYPSCVNLPS